MAKYVKLPNDEVVLVDDNGFIQCIVEVDLSELIENDLGGFFNHLSELATGTDVLGEINYSVIGHRGNTLEISVSGNIDLITVEDFDIDSAPMLEFEVEVTRIAYGTRTLRLSARSWQEAIDIADFDAGNHRYSESNSEYIINAQLSKG